MLLREGRGAVLISFLVAMKKYPNTCNLSGERVYFGLQFKVQSIKMGKSRHEELDADGHTAVRREGWIHASVQLLFSVVQSKSGKQWHPQGGLAVGAQESPHIC